MNGDDIYVPEWSSNTGLEIPSPKREARGKATLNKNENASAFTYLPRFPNFSD